MLKNFKWTDEMTNNAAKWYDCHNGGRCACEHPCVNGNIKIIFYTGGGVFNPRPIVECEHCGERFDLEYNPMSFRAFKATELLKRYSEALNCICNTGALLDNEALILEEVETFLRDLSEGCYGDYTED